MCRVCESKIKSLVKEREEIWRNLLAAGNSPSSSDRELANLAREIARVNEKVGIMQHANDLHRDIGEFSYEKPVLSDLDEGHSS